jgi:hypothetical protein
MDEPLKAKKDERAPRGAGDPQPVPNEPSFGRMSDRHWSRARAGTNEEALEYYRERSRAPGVAEGGAERNFYCMRCDGVIPFDVAGEVCPHCGVALEGMSKRYFNWVEINEPPKSDARALLPFALAGLSIVAVIAVLVWYVVH